MKKLRNVNTNKRKKERKAKQKELQEQTALLMKHPKECCVCNVEFVRTPTTVKEWHVTVVQEKKAVHLTCPSCWAILTEAMEKLDGT